MNHAIIFIMPISNHFYSIVSICIYKDKRQRLLKCTAAILNRLHRFEESHTYFSPEECPYLDTQIFIFMPGDTINLKCFYSAERITC